jgi:hypothetical protein
MAAGKVPVDTSGEVITSAGKVKAATMLSNMHGESSAVKGAIHQAVGKAAISGGEHAVPSGFDHVAASKSASHFGAF